MHDLVFRGQTTKGKDLGDAAATPAPIVAAKVLVLELAGGKPGESRELRSAGPLFLIL